MARFKGTLGSRCFPFFGIAEKVKDSGDAAVRYNFAESKVSRMSSAVDNNPRLDSIFIFSYKYTASQVDHAACKN